MHISLSLQDRQQKNWYCEHVTTGRAWHEGCDTSREDSAELSGEQGRQTHMVVSGFGEAEDSQENSPEFSLFSKCHCSVYSDGGRVISGDRGQLLRPSGGRHRRDLGSGPVELDTMAVAIEDYGVVPIPARSGNYTPEGIKAPTNVPSFPMGMRTDMKPLSITQPEGTSFQVEGQQVTWQKWRFRVGFTPREGLVLHLVAYFDRGRYRPILYRASLSEMYVPYGDASPSHNFKNVFDAGEVGIGVLANSLELGCDCLGAIHYFNVTVNDAAGKPCRSRMPSVCTKKMLVSSGSTWNTTRMVQHERKCAGPVG